MIRDPFHYSRFFSGFKFLFPFPAIINFTSSSHTFRFTFIVYAFVSAFVSTLDRKSKRKKKTKSRSGDDPGSDPDLVSSGQLPEQALKAVGVKPGTKHEGSVQVLLEGKEDVDIAGVELTTDQVQLM